VIDPSEQGGYKPRHPQWEEPYEEPGAQPPGFPSAGGITPPPLSTPPRRIAGVPVADLTTGGFPLSVPLATYRKEDVLTPTVFLEDWRPNEILGEYPMLPPGARPYGSPPIILATPEDKWLTAERMKEIFPQMNPDYIDYMFDVTPIYAMQAGSEGWMNVPPYGELRPSGGYAPITQKGYTLSGEEVTIPKGGIIIEYNYPENPYLLLAHEFGHKVQEENLFGGEGNLRAWTKVAPWEENPYWDRYRQFREDVAQALYERKPWLARQIISIIGRGPEPTGRREIYAEGPNIAYVQGMIGNRPTWQEIPYSAWPFYQSRYLLNAPAQYPEVTLNRSNLQNWLYLEPQIMPEITPAPYIPPVMPTPIPLKLR